MSMMRKTHQNVKKGEKTTHTDRNHLIDWWRGREISTQARNTHTKSSAGVFIPKCVRHMQCSVAFWLILWNSQKNSAKKNLQKIQHFGFF